MTFAPGLLATDQPRALENREVLRHGHHREGERPGDLADAKSRLRGEPRDDCAPCWITEGSEHAVEPGGGVVRLHLQMIN